MNFDFSEEQKLLQQTARDFLEENSPLSVCREILESDQPYATGLWKGMAQMGWQGAAISEEYGGAGFGYLELAMIAGEVGRALAPVPFSSSVYLATEALIRFGTDAQKNQYLPKLASGEAIGCFASAEGPGQMGEAGIATTFKGGKLSGTKAPVADGDIADFAIVVAKSSKGVSLAIANLDGSGVERKTLKALDPSRSMASIQFDGADAELLGTEGEGWAHAEHVLDRAAVLVAFEQVGAAERCLEITREFTLGRYAFGRPIASFQAIKHRLADAWCEIELARSNSYYGAWALSNDEPELNIAACVSRIQATHAFDLNSVEMIEFHGGVGYTWEYDCHLFYRRAKLLGTCLGNDASWKERLISRLEANEAAA
jgi:acyl-CoA dehydrogenase